MEITNIRNRTGFRNQRIHAILEGFLDKIERSLRPHPEVVEMASYAVDRFMEIAYEADALDTCLQLSRISVTLNDMVMEQRPLADCLLELQSFRQPFHQAWIEECDRFDASADTIVDYSSRMNPQAGEASAAGLTDSVSQNDSAVPQSSFPVTDAIAEDSAASGSFDYLGTEEHPFDEELTAIFLTETEEQFPTAERLILEIENQPENANLLHELFRVMHTIKGNAGFLGLRAIIHLTHAMEQYLDSFRNQESEITTISTNLMLEGVDAQKTLCANLCCRYNFLTNTRVTEAIEPVDWEGLSNRFIGT
ncbi:MAG: Hpt domain-containing protein [SAR324 cluster bacterium]|nr:Hpt domain-containing protein [SAR324 cluster bacterium]